MIRMKSHAMGIKRQIKKGLTLWGLESLHCQTATLRVGEPIYRVKTNDGLVHPWLSTLTSVDPGCFEPENGTFY